MTRVLTTAAMRCFSDTVDPGLSESGAENFNWWFNTTSGRFFSCLDETLGSQAWEQIVIQGDDISFNDLTATAGGAVQTNTSAGNAFSLDAYDTLGAVYTPFITLTANNPPTCDLSDSVTKSGQYIYRAGGTDVAVADGGSGASTLTGVLTGNGTGAFTASTITQYGTLVAGASNAVASIAPSATSGVALISQGASANPAFGTVVVAGGGSGATTLTGILTGNGTSAFTASTVTENGVLYGGASNAVSSLAVAASGTVLIGNTGAAPSFSASPVVTSISIQSGGPTITSGSGAPGGSQPKGSLYLRTDGTTTNDRMYVATDAVGGWTAVITAT